MQSRRNCKCILKALLSRTYVFNFSALLIYCFIFPMVFCSCNKCQMISEAITSLKDRHGSSQPAIAKFVERKHPELLPPNFKKLLSIQLKKFVKSEKLTKVKNSYKISAPKKSGRRICKEDPARGNCYEEGCGQEKQCSWTWTQHEQKEGK